jgi:prolyl-tRNA editing enzyme YbaK/EbsC (Cys-tRNA(Pro) deacylase)
MSKDLSSSAQKVQDALNQEGFGHQVIELTDTTRTAQDAALAVGCEVGQIVKSLVFKGKQTRTPVLVVASG